MVTVDIRGKQFPLCLTVAAVDEINEQCGSIKNIGTFLDGASEGRAFDLGQSSRNTAWMLGLLIREGEENRLLSARLNGDAPERIAVPDSNMLRHLLTVAEAQKCREDVFRAVSESLTQEIEASYPKNAENADQK